MLRKFKFLAAAVFLAGFALGSTHAIAQQQNQSVPYIFSTQGGTVPASELDADFSYALSFATDASNLTNGVIDATVFPAFSGDCTTQAGLVALTCTKTNGVPFTSAATTPLGQSGAALGLLSTANSYSALQTFSSGLSTPSISGMTSPLNVAQGGTGLSTLTSHSVLLGEGSNLGSTSPFTAGQLLIGQGASLDPAPTSISGDITLTAMGVATVTGSNGSAFGTGAFATVGTSGGDICLLNTVCTYSAEQIFGNGAAMPLLAAHGLLIAEGSSSINATAAMTAGEILVGQGSTMDPVAELMGGDATMSSTGAVTVGSIGGKAVSLTGPFTIAGGGFSLTANLTGTTSVTFPLSGTLATVGGNLGTPSAVVLTNATGLPVAQVTGALGYTPAHSGANSDITSLAGLTTSLSVAQGGTGAATFTAHGILLGEGTAAQGATAAMTGGQLLIGQGATSDPTPQTISGDATLSAAGALTVTGVSHLSGTLPATVTLPAPSATTLGGVESYTAPAHQWLTALSTAGAFSASQPGCADLSNATAACSTAVGTSGAVLPLLSTANTWGAEQSFPASAAANAGANFGQGSAPTSPVNGDFWVTNTGAFVRAGGNTFQLGGSALGVSSWTSPGGTVQTGAVTMQSSDVANALGYTPLNPATPVAIGTTTPNGGSFTTLGASGTVSGVGFSNYLAAPPAIGGGTPNAVSATNLSASGTVSGTGFANYLASPPAIGGTSPAAATFTSVTLDGAQVGAWQSYTPSSGPTPASGSFTTAAYGTAQYTRINKTILFQLSFSVTTVGSASGCVTVALPVASAGVGFAVVNAINTGTGNFGGGLINAGASTFNVCGYSAATLFSAGASVLISGAYLAGS
jgi:hypothetical protein